MKYLLALIFTLLMGGVAHGEGWVIVRPVVVDGGDPAFATALGRGIQRGLRRQFGARQIGETLEPDEMRTVLDCLQLNANCADRAARAVGADGAIYAAVRQIGSRALVTINLVGAERRRTLKWRIDFRGKQLEADELQRLGDALGDEVFNDMPARSGLFSPQRQPVQINGRARTIDGLVRTPEGAYTLQLGSTDLAIDLLPGEIVVLPAHRAPDRSDPAGEDWDLRVPTYTALGLSGVGLLIAGGTGLQLRNTQAEYENAGSGSLVLKLKDQGDKQARLINLMLLSSSALAVTGLVLLLLD